MTGEFSEATDYKRRSLIRLSSEVRKAQAVEVNTEDVGLSSKTKIVMQPGVLLKEFGVEKRRTSQGTRSTNNDKEVP